MADASDQQWTSISVVRVKPDIGYPIGRTAKECRQSCAQESRHEGTAASFETAVFGESYEYGGHNSDHHQELMPV